jgi:dolichol-phosphate mannosyltransferase
MTTLTPALATHTVPPSPDLTVVVPTFQERANVPLLVERLDAALVDIAWEAIFVDDDSPDGTAKAVREIGRVDPRIRCIHRVGRRGLSGACIEGMMAAQAPIVAVIDADLQHDETILGRMFTAVTTGSDIAIGTRYSEGGSAAGLEGYRGAASRFATSLARVLGVTASDPMSGFFMMRRDLVESVAPRLSSQGFKILLDILSSAPEPLKIAEIPYTFRARQHGASKLDGRVMLDFLGLLLAKLSGDALSLRFFTFAMIGAIGVVVNLIALRLGIAAGLRFTIAQLVATFVAMTSNFALNNLVTYRDQRLRGWRILRGLIVFYAVCGFGTIANIGVASWAFRESSGLWLAGLSGAVMSAVWNYAMSTLFVWRRR